MLQGTALYDNLVARCVAVSRRPQARHADEAVYATRDIYIYILKYLYLWCWRGRVGVMVHALIILERSCGAQAAVLKELAEASGVIDYRRAARTASSSSFDSTEGTGGGSDVSRPVSPARRNRCAARVVWYVLLLKQGNGARFPACNCIFCLWVK